MVFLQRQHDWGDYQGDQPEQSRAQPQDSRNQSLHASEKHSLHASIQVKCKLSQRIREYLNFRWKEEAEIDLQQEEQLLNELSDDLKEELKRQANSVFFKHCLFIKNNFSIEF